MTVSNRCPECGSIHEDELNARIAQLTAELSEWKQDAERLAKEFIWVDGEYGEWHCIHCDQYATSAQREIQHYDNCPITLHRQLIEKYKESK